MFLFAFTSQGLVMLVFFVPFCLGGIAGSTLKSVISEQGQLQGALASFMSASAIIEPLIMLYLFNYFTRTHASFQFAGAPFIFGGILML